MGWLSDLFHAWLQAFTQFMTYLSLHFTLTATFSLHLLEQSLASAGYPAVTFFVMIESMGVPFPGETMLLLASFYAAVNHQLQIPLVITSAAIGAILGDNIGYTVGRLGGRRLIERFGRYLFIKPAHLASADRFFARHGDKTVFFGRFTTLLRLWAAFFAGVNRMNWRIFLLYNAAGGILWSILYGTLGYVAGRIFHDNFAQIERLAGTVSGAIGFTLVGILVLIIAFFWLRRRHAQSQKARAQQTSSSPIDVI